MRPTTLDERIAHLAASPLAEQDTTAALLTALIMLAQERSTIPVARAMTALGLATSEYAARKRELASLGGLLARRIVEASERRTA